MDGQPYSKLPSNGDAKAPLLFPAGTEMPPGEPFPQEKAPNPATGFLKIFRFRLMRLWGLLTPQSCRIWQSKTPPVSSLSPCSVSPIPHFPFHFPENASQPFITALSMSANWCWPLPVDAPLGVQQMCLKACLQDQCCVFRVHYFKYTVKVNT